MTWVYIGLGVLLGMLLMPVVLWFGLKWVVAPLAKRWFERWVKKLGEMGAMSPAVPPFRVELTPDEEPEWAHEDLVQQATAEFEALGYRPIGDFTADQFYGMTMRAFVNADARAYGVVYDWIVQSVGVVVDIVAYFEDGTGVTCSNAPVEGLDRPPWETNYLIEKKTEDGAIAEIAAKLTEVTQGRNPVPLEADQFAKVFYDAYARKMDWQVNRGGPTADELRRNLLKVHNAGETSSEEEMEEAIRMTQAQWKSAIAEFVAEKTRERFLRHVTKMSAGEWEDVRDRLFIVHQISVPDELKDELKRRLMYQEEDVDEEDEDEEERREEQFDRLLAPHFEGRPPREGFESAQAVLPQQLRYQRIARIRSPWPADVYVEPQD